MKRITVLILLALVLASAVSSAGAIVGGEEDFDHGNVGAIMMVWPQFGEDFVGRLCTATLIHERALLTAAHCHNFIVNQGIGYDQVWVTFDQDPFDDNAIKLDVVNFILHPDFKSGKDYHDIALVILKESVDVKEFEIQSLPRIGYMDDLFESLNRKDRRDLELTIVGYGTSEYMEPPAALLDAVRQTGTVTFETLLESEIKTSNSNPDNVNGCQGDSGGPQFYQDKGRKEVLVGVYSRSGVSLGCDGPMFHYRVDTASAQEFIEAYLPHE